MHYPEFINLSKEQLAFIDQINQNKQFLPFTITSSVINTITKLHQANEDYSPITKQVFPDVKEKIITKYENSDPLGAISYKKTSRMIHQYKNRILLLTTDNCFSYCRYCFRKDYVLKNNQAISDEELNEVCKYLQENSDIKEILLSGGDPLTLSNNRIEYIISQLKKHNKNLIIRICSRAIFFNPLRIDDELLKIMNNNFPIWFVPHINHSFEVDYRYSQESVKAIEKLRKNGIPMQSQTVLLKGINDSVTILKDLFNKLVQLGIKPGYLFQGDLAKGTSHFRVSLRDGINLYLKLKEELSGLSLPTYAVDLPGGGGKFNLLQHSLACKKYIFTENSDNYLIQKDNKSFYYPFE